MSIFEKFWGGSNKEETKDAVVDKSEVNTVADESIVSHKTKIEDIKNAIGDIKELGSKRQDLLEKHRDTVQELRDLGVRELSPDDVPRSDTANEILNPIEEELAQISREITEKRKDFDLHPNRQEVLSKRMARLNELKERVEEQFDKTPSGEKIKSFEKQIYDLKHDSTKQNFEIEKEIYKIADEKSYLFRNDKLANDFAKTIDRINYLININDVNLADSNRSDYDQNGFNRI